LRVKSDKLIVMPTFDIVSEIDMTEVINAADQASREVKTRYDFKDTNSSVELKEKEMLLEIESSSEDRIRALQQVVEEKLVKRKVSLRSVEFGDPQTVGGGRSKIAASLKAGVSQEMAKKINVLIKDMKLKGVQSSNQGDQVRVTGKKRDILQEVIAELKKHEFDLPLQYQNFRD